MNISFYTQSGLLAHFTCTPSIYANINISMYKFTWDSQITLFSFIQHPNLCSIPAPLGDEVHRGLALEGRNLEEGEVLLSSLHRYLQKVLSLLSGTIGQKAKYLHYLSAAAQIPDVSSNPSHQFISSVKLYITKWWLLILNAKRQAQSINHYKMNGCDNLLILCNHL